MSDPFDLGNEDPSPQTISREPAPAQSAGLTTSQRAAQAMRSNSFQHLLEGLNEAQHDAVMAPDGPLLVLAGAGTGKTRVLTTRIARKLTLGEAWPSQILAVTFTNKAAREMKERIEKMVGGSMEGMPWLGTFHSLSVKILRRHAELVGLRPDFTILDTDDQIRLLKQLIKAENIDEKRWPGRQLAGLIDRWKNRGWTPENVPDSEGAFFADGRGVALYDQYQKRLKILNATDFGDLLLETVRLFQENDEILTEYQTKFTNILVDEYQDTNVVQYLWLRLLAQKHSNICCVGDDDQSIYGWRGAEVDNILRFERDFPGAVTVKLERNYRSTSHILGAASGLIEANQKRLGKTLWTEQNDGEPVRIRGVWDSEEEARLTADDIEDFQRKKHPLNDIAILVRASFQMREFEDRFISLAIPYRVIGGPRFYERAEIRDANAYFRIINQVDDDLAFERICNKPRRGLGDVALQTLHNAARSQGISLYRAACQVVATDALKPAARKSLTGFLNALDRWRSLIDNTPHTELAEIILDESGYTAMWQADRSPEAPGKLENLKELIRSMQEFATLGEYLEHITLVMDAQSNESEDKVSIMTLHAAKGLEFETVFLPGFEEGLFPHQRSLDETGSRGLEEERRLAYVGITRAKRNLTISFAGNRKTHGQWNSALPSRFIDEIPEANVEVLSADTGYQPSMPRSRFANEFNASSYSSPGWRRAQENMSQNYQTKAPISASTNTPRSTSTQNQINYGQRIFHQKFGYGRVEAIEGNKLTVRFDKAGIKKVIDTYVERI
ncbi:UvrD-helicase domain-containing protein [Alphaproteobacteria bacterium]|nr:UvrD-helicase domain-containing protein [Alphaproteobacteria bacterium]